MASAQVAWAEPQAITQAKSQAAALQARVNELNDQAEILVEKYDSANVELGQTKAAVGQNSAKLKQVQQDEAKAEGVLSARLVQIYEQGSSGALDVLLSASSWSDLLNRMTLLERISAQDNALVAQVAAYQAQVANQQTKLAQELKKEQVAATQVQADKQAVQVKLAANQQALKGDQQQIAQMEKAWQAQQAKLAAEARAAAAQAALKAQQEQAAALRAQAAQKAALKAQQARAAALQAQQEQAAAAKPSTQDAPAAAPPAQQSSSGSGGNQTTVSVPVSGSGARAVQIALKYLGVPYAWGGASPSGFDCSGLVMYVYRQLGVSLPHSAAMQYECGTHVSRDQLQPGDLVFYGSPIHHVGIYVGNGDMIDAPYTGVSVRIDPLQSDYAGATRIF